MKHGEAALEQYSELAEALRATGAGWVVDEVGDILARGKLVQARALPGSDLEQYEIRLVEEAGKGRPVGRVKQDDLVGVPYSESERLELLVEATQRVIDVSVRCHDYISHFAASHEIQRVSLEDPASQDSGVDSIRRRPIPLASQSDPDDRTDRFDRLLRFDVLD